MLTPKTLSNQLINMLRCYRLKPYLKNTLFEFPETPIQDKRCMIELKAGKPKKNLPNQKSLKENLNILLQQSHLKPWMEGILWELYWFVNVPNFENLHTFLEITRISIEKSLNNDNPLNYCNLKEVWPFLQLIIEKQHNKEFEEAKRLVPFLIKDIHISISNKITDILRFYNVQSEEEKREIFIATATGIGLDNFWNELTPLANEMSLNCHDLLVAYLDFYQSFALEEAHRIEINTTQTVSLIEAIESTLKQSSEQRDNKKISSLLWRLTLLNFPDDPEIFRRLRVLLELCLNNYSKYSHLSFNIFFSINIIFLFIRLLSSENQAQQIGLYFFSTLTLETLLKVDDWYIFSNISNKSYLKTWLALNSFLNSEEEAIRIGSVILLSKLISYSRSVEKFKYIESQELINACLDIDWVWSFVNHKNDHRCFPAIPCY